MKLKTRLKTTLKNTLKTTHAPMMLFSLTTLAATYAPPANAQQPDTPAYCWTVGGHTGNNQYGYDESVLSPNGKLLATAAPDGTLKIWNARTTQLVRTISASASSLYCVAFSPDGTKIAAGGSTYFGNGSTSLFGGAVGVYDVATGEQIADLPTTIWNVTAVVFSPDGTRLTDAGYLHNSSTSLDDGVIETYRIADHKLLKTMSAAERIGKLAYLPDGQTLLSAGYHFDSLTSPGISMLQRWNPLTGTLLNDLPTQLTRPRGLAFSPDKSLFAVTGSNAAGLGTLELWNSATLKRQTTLTGKLNAINAASFDAAGKNILVGGYKNVYDPLYDLTYHRGAVELWGLNGQRAYTSDTLTQSEINSTVFDTNGKTFVAASNGLDVNRYATQNVALTGVFTQLHRGVIQVAACDVNDTVAVQDSYGALSLYSACTGALLPAPARTTGFVRFVPHSADMVFLDGGTQKQIKIVAPGGAVSHAVTSQLSVIVDVAFSPDGALAVVMGISKPVGGVQYKSVEIYRVSDWTRQRQINAFAFAPGEISQGINIAAAFAPDDKQIVIGVDGLDAGGNPIVGSLATYNVQNGKIKASADLAALSKSDTLLIVSSITFSGDGKCILLGESGEDYHTVGVRGAVQTFDAGLKPIRRYDAPEYIYTMKLSPSGENLIFGGYTMDTSTGRHNGVVTSMNIADGTVAVRYDDQLGTGVYSLDFRSDGASALFVARADATFGAIALPCFAF